LTYFVHNYICYIYLYIFLHKQFFTGEFNHNKIYKTFTSGNKMKLKLQLKIILAMIYYFIKMTK